MDTKQTLTSGNGAPISDDNNSMTVGVNGSVLLQDIHMLEKLTHFNRERIPERVVHAKGAGAHGYFEVTHDITKYSKASLFSAVGEKTPVFVRFSTVGGEKGSSDAARDPRGFAIKHYTKDGIWDMVGNNTPVFFIRDPIKFPDFIHSQKRNPQTNLPDPNAFWDFLTLTPESVHQATILMSDRGIPATYRNMHGFSSHTLRFVNDKDEGFFVKIHYKTDAGIKNVTNEESMKLGPDHATKDLFDHIEAGNEATWTVSIQVMPEADAATYKWNVFDVTKIWPHSDYPLQQVGKLVLNRNPENYFAEVEQAAFSPGNLVNGIEASEDRMLQARMFAYGDAQRYRVGPNHQQIPINCPYASGVRTYQRDGLMSIQGNGGNKPNYYPNSYEGSPAPAPAHKTHAHAQNGIVARFPHSHPNDDFAQAGELYSRVMDDKEKALLVSNIVSHAKFARPDVQKRVVCYFSRANRELGAQIAKSLL
mmetsp:Transcript_19951/g.32881  ORF Transcript_19951/g.32881 Transcript_19951/m.32881 type:complete len:478 (-) Transcript_19951:112-1545(-)